MEAREILLNQIKGISESFKDAGTPLKWGDVENIVQQATDHELTEISHRLGPLLTYIDRPSKSPTFTIDMTKRFFSLTGLHCHGDDLDSLLTKNDVVEVLNLQGIQIFRNLELFKYTSYSLADIISTHWTNLYERPAGIDQLIFKEWIKITTSETFQAIPINVPQHILQEKRGERRCVAITLKWAWNLFDSSGKRQAVLVTQTAERIKNNNVAFI